MVEKKNTYQDNPYLNYSAPGRLLASSWVPVQENPGLITCAQVVDHWQRCAEFLQVDGAGARVVTQVVVDCHLPHFSDVIVTGAVAGLVVMQQVKWQEFYGALVPL